MKKILLIVAILTMTIMLLIYPENCLNGAKSGLDIWFSIVLPSLFPFMAASFILLETGIVRLIAYMLEPLTRFLFASPGESGYVFLASALSGYPVGAKISADLYTKGQISEHNAQRMICFTSVSGPVFITGAVSAGMLGLAGAGIYLAATHYLSAIMVGIIFGMVNRKKIAKKTSPIRFRDAVKRFKKDIEQCRPFGEILAASIEKAISTLLTIGGFIIFFSVVIEMLSASGIMDIAALVYSPIAGFVGLEQESTKALIFGGVEMAAGCAKGALLDVNITQKLCILASIIAFGGASIHTQTRAVCRAAGLVPKGFLLAKSLQAFLAYLLCSLSLYLFPMTIAVSGITANTKTTAYFGIVFAAVSVISLLFIKLYQKKRISKSTFTFVRKL